MKHTHKLLAGIALLGFAGILAASAGTGGVGQQPGQFKAILENKTKHPILLYAQDGKTIGNLLPQSIMPVSFSPQAPIIYLSYLGKDGMLGLSEMITASGATVRKFQAQHPKLDAYTETIESDQPRIIITEK